MVEQAGRQPLERVSPVLVGRDDALELAMRRWDAVVGGAGHLLLLSGEAGIGKTRLLDEIAQRVQPAVVVTAAAYARESETVGALMLTLADAVRRAGLGDAVRERLVRTDDEADPARRRRFLVGDLVDILSTLSADGPVLLRLDDLHWADELSLDVIERLAATLAGQRLMVVGAYRGDELPNREWRARLLARRQAEEVRLARLGVDHVFTMTEAITGEQPSSELLALLVARSDGIPFHLEELLAAGDAEGVPDTVAEAVQGRTELLDEEPRQLLEAAAVVGRTFDLDLLGAVAGSDAAALDRAIAALVAARLVVAVPGGETYTFRHALIGDVVYEGIAPFRRRALHLAAARAAEGAGSDESYLSQHYEGAHDAANAYRHALAGARAAAGLSSHREAAELFYRAQRTAPRDLDTASRARLLVELGTELAAVDANERAVTAFANAVELYRSAGDETAAALVIPRLMATRHLLGAPLVDRLALASEALQRVDPSAGHAVARLHAAVAAATMLDRRLEDSLAAGDRARAILDRDDALRVELDATVGSVLLFAGRADEGWPMLESAIALGSAHDFEADTARSFRMLGSCASVLVEYPLAFDSIERGLAYSAATERWNDHYYLLAHLGHVRWATGDWQGAESDARLALADGHGITTRITALIVLGYLAMGRGEFERARVHLEEGLALARPMAELQRISPLLWGLAETAVLSGDAMTAVELCERGFALSAEVGDAAYLFPYVVTGTRALLEQRSIAGARDWIRRCTDAIQRRGITGTLPCLPHAAGLVDLAEGQTGSARTSLESAHRGWLERGRFWEAQHVTLDLARCALRSRRPADAARLVTEVREGASRVGSRVLVSLAEAVGASESVGPLSARELEVARLVAEGATNREIAERLVISPKTASSHLEHILAKLGVSRRAEVAAWYTRQQT